jgi:hypothetical protein
VSSNTGDSNTTAETSVNNTSQNSTWARLIKKVNGVDPLVYTRCGSKMVFLTAIIDPDETKKILAHLVKLVRSPPNFDATSCWLKDDIFCFISTSLF